MGEGLYLESGVIPNAVMFVPEGRVVGGCYGEFTQITRDAYINYDVCPSGTGALRIPFSGLNFDYVTYPYQRNSQ
jgi:hypothetical protein